jgi:hypothetical protein
MTIEEGREMIGTGMAFGIGTAVAGNPCATGSASVLLEAFHEGRQPARTPRRFRERREPSEISTGVLRIARAPVLA